jgi:hypothetical protein
MVVVQRGVGLHPEPGSRDLHPAWIRPWNVGSMCTVHQLLLSAISRCTTAIKGGTYIMKGVVKIALYRSSDCHVLFIQYRLQHTVACNAREFIKPPKTPPTGSPKTLPTPPTIHRFQSDTCPADTVIHSPIVSAPPLLTVRISEALLTRKPHFEAVR